MENTIDRKIVSKENIALALQAVNDKISYRLKQKGEGTMASRHEILGIITEEFDELKDAVRTNDNAEFCDELLDIAVACVFGLACVYEGTLDW